MKHELNTIKDIAEMVSKKNLNGFLKDFKQFLKICIDMRNKDNKFVKLRTDRFVWYDDGNWGKVKQINITINKKP